MGKRLHRVGPDEFGASIPDLQGKKVNIILQNGIVYFGTLEGISGDVITFKDLRFHKHKFALSELLEIIYDEKTV